MLKRNDTKFRKSTEKQKYIRMEITSIRKKIKKLNDNIILLTYENSLANFENIKNLVEIE